MSNISAMKAPSREALIAAIEAGESIPDHLLPVGIHRTSPHKWRAHLMTGGRKFSGPPRDSIREAVADRRRLCEETGVEFVLYGKQSHARPEQRPSNWVAAETVAFKGTDKRPLDSEIRLGGVMKRPIVPDLPFEFPMPKVGKAGRFIKGFTGRGRSVHVLTTMREAPVSWEMWGVAELESLNNEDMLLHTQMSATSFSPTAPSIPISLNVHIRQVPILDRFLIPVDALPGDLMGYAQALLIDFGLQPDPESIAVIVSEIREQMLSAIPVLHYQPSLPPNPRSARKVTLSHHPPKDPRYFQVNLKHPETGDHLISLKWNCMTDEKITQNFVKTFASEQSIPRVHDLLFQMIEAIVSYKRGLMQMDGKKE